MATADPASLAAALRRRTDDLEAERASAAAAEPYVDVRTRISITESVARLHDLDDPAAVVAAAATEACHACGLSRTMLSRVSRSRWIPEVFHATPDAPASPGFLPYVVGSHVALTHDVLESEIVRRRTALLVTDARQHLRTLKPMMAAGNVSSYVVAPIVIERRVIGLLQADRRGQPREVDETDRLNLAMFASELSLLLECLTLRERVEQQRNQLQASLLEATRAAGAILDEEFSLMPHTPPANPAASEADASPAAPGLWTAFTPRQQEVLQLMLTGAPNHQIAADLGIALATVKSHVKAILRTLRVSSRSEAVARLIDQHPVGA